MYTFIYLYFHIGTIYIILRLNECFSLRDVGSTGQIVMV